MSDIRIIEALDHISRPALPWRDEELTECGRAITAVKTITRDEVRARLNSVGRKRTAFTVCMTCLEAARWNADWATAPERVLERNLRSRQDSERLRRELIAIAALIEAHPDEFYDAVNGLADTPSLAAHRRSRRQGGHRA